MGERVPSFCQNVYAREEEGPFLRSVQLSAPSESGTNWNGVRKSNSLDFRSERKTKKPPKLDQTAKTISSFILGPSNSESGGRGRSGQIKFPRSSFSPFFSESFSCRQIFFPMGKKREQKNCLATDWRRKRERTSRSSLPLLCHNTTFCCLSGCELKRPPF